MNFAFSLSSRLVRAVLAWAALPFDVYFTSKDLTSSRFLFNPSASKTGSSDPSTHIIHRRPPHQTHQHLQQCFMVSHPAEYFSVLLTFLLEKLTLLVLSMMLQVFQVYQVPTLEVKYLWIRNGNRPFLVSWMS
jgi:hypothetical protein